MSVLPSAGVESGIAPVFRRLLDELGGSLITDTSLDEEVWEPAVLAPARSVLTRNGKGLRGRLVERSWALAGGAPEKLPLLLPMCVELLHAGSLVVDDIEDDSRHRRGQPALHRVVGVPLALNTGNWLYFLATDLVGALPFGADVRLALLQDVVHSLRRCHEGQALDLSVHSPSTRRRDIPRLVETATRLKTGAFMGLAARIGTRAAEGPPELVAAMGAFGTEVGIGLQMLDDWSGISSPARREKGIEDLRLGRLTWPWAWLAEHTDDVTFAETARQGRELTLDWQADRLLRRLRDHVEAVALRSVRKRFDCAVAGLEGAVGSSPHVDRLTADIRVIEGAFG